MNDQPVLRAAIFAAIIKERARQDVKWGYPRTDLTQTDWMTILMEEVGEASDESLSVRFSGTHIEEYRKELTHAAAVIVSILEHLALAAGEEKT